MVVSSVTPKTLLAMLTQSSCEDRRVASTTWYSAASVADVSGTPPALANSTPLCTSRVASPPSSRIMLGRWSPQSRMRSVHSQYSSSDSPFQANTGTPLGASGVPSRPTTIAAAAWSWVEKMLQDAQRTSAPSSTRVSISTAVWMVMCSEPGDPGAAQRTAVAVALAKGHQAGHLVLGEGDLLASEGGKVQVSDSVIHTETLLAWPVLTDRALREEQRWRSWCS